MTEYHIENYEFENGINPFLDRHPNLKLPHGILSIKEMECLYKYSKGIVLDIGTFCGKSATILSLNAEKVYSIDMFFEKGSLHEKHLDYNYEIVKNKFKNTNVKIIKGDSRFVEINDNFDTIFFDSNHEYDFIKTDFEHWKPKLKSNGVFIFHDYYYLYTNSVIRYISELLQNKIIEKVEIMDSCFVAKLI
ncbi:MAG: class I SAM-dependent methyltransferase [Candidatus Hodarchaeota archaeon]